mgnify:CR=1 FL=1
MNERELLINRIGPVARRLKELGINVPDMPDGEGNEFTRCTECRGHGLIEKEDLKSEEGETNTWHCPMCGGSGQTVINNLLEWQKNIIQLWQETMKSGSQGNI